MTDKRSPQGTRPPRIPRRRFLTGAAVAVGVPYFVPASALGKAGQAAPSERIVVAGLGTGRRSRSVLGGVMQCAGAQVVAACDAMESARNTTQAAVNRHYGGNVCTVYGDFRAVLARDDVDAVVIAPQDHWHAVMAVAAAKAGKDIYCEKPLGVAYAESRAIVAAVRRYDRIFQTGTQQRSDRKFRFACELARSGYLGKVHTVEVAAPGPHYVRKYQGAPVPEPVPEGFDYDMYHGPAAWKPYCRGRIDWPGWYLIWDYCTGFIVNWGVHHLDIAHWGCPEIGREAFEVTCKADYRTDALSDNVNGWRATFRLAGGLTMHFSDTGHPYEQGCKFIGDQGWVHVNRRGISANPASLLRVALKPGDVHLHDSAHHQADFIRAVRARRDTIAPVEAGHVASTLGMLADTAARVGRTLKWDPAAERFIDDAEANRWLTRPMRSPWAL